MQELVYYQDQYKTEIEAKVLKVEGNKILLDKTIFIPQRARTKNSQSLPTASGVLVFGLTE